MKTIFSLFFSLAFLNSYAQNKNAFYALDANMNQTVLDSSKYILWIHEKEDSSWQWDYYRTWGPLVKSTGYADHDGTIPNGKFFLYNQFGNLDSCGNFSHGFKNGPFYKYKSVSKDSMVILKKYEYVNDNLTNTINYQSINKENRNDTINEIEAGYPGGSSKWILYQNQNFQYPAILGSRIIPGIVWVHVTIDEEGILNDPYIQKSVEYSIDQEALRLVVHSGKWVPATKDNSPVKSDKVIPIIYELPIH
jgi:periplasmic protein TonB